VIDGGLDHDDDDDRSSFVHRGLAHVGMIKAMQEFGIPIDMVGGTSMGSFIGCLWAEERQYPKFNIRAKEWAMVCSRVKFWTFFITKGS
jgi:predicted acylesterase/phospholipase RssA